MKKNTSILFRLIDFNSQDQDHVIFTQYIRNPHFSAALPDTIDDILGDFFKKNNQGLFSLQAENYFII